MQASIQLLLPLTRQIRRSALEGLQGALQVATAEWYQSDRTSCDVPVRIDFALAPEGGRICHVRTRDAAPPEEIAALKTQLAALPVPKVHGMVAFTLFTGPKLFVESIAETTWQSHPFCELLPLTKLHPPDQLRMALYQAVRSAKPEYQIPLRTVHPPPWYQRVLHVISGKPFYAGYLAGKPLVLLDEPLPAAPSSGLLTGELLAAVQGLSEEELKDRVAGRTADSCLETAACQYLLSLRRYERGQLAEAIEHLTLALEAFPDAAYLHELRAGWLLQDGQTKACLADCEKVIKLQDEWAAGHYTRGTVYLQLEAWSEAEADFESCTGRDALNADAWLHLALARANQLRIDAALEAVNEALTCDPYHIGALATRIQMYNHPGLNLQDAERVNALVKRDLDWAIRYGHPHPFFLQQRCEFYLQSGAYADALADCERALALNDQDEIALGMRGAARLALEDPDAALADLNRAIDLENEAPAILDARAQILLSRGEFESAKLDCDRAIEHHPAFPHVYLTRGMALTYLEEMDAAKADFQRALQLAPDWEAPYRHLGQLHMHLGELPPAYQCFSQAIECQPDLAGNWMLRAICQATAKEREKALFDLDRAVELNPDLAEAYGARAALHMDSHRLDAAIEDLSQLLRLHPDNVGALLQRAQCRLANAQADEARDDFDRVIQLDPTLAAAYSGRGRAWIQSGDAAQAAEDFRQAMLQDPVNADSFEISRLLAEAAVHHRAEDYDNALGKIAEALSIDGNSPHALNMRASCYWYSELFVEAADDLTRLLELATQDAEFNELQLLTLLNNRGQVYVEMGEFEKALADLNRAVALGERLANRTCRAYSLSGRALAYAGLNQFEQAEEDFQRSVDDCPENAWVYYNQGLVYDKLGRKDHAVLCFELALALDEPKLTPRKRRRAQAYLQRCRSNSRVD